MSVIPPPAPDEAIDYPESDGKPMADNTRQFEWIYHLYGNIAAIFRSRADVFVKGNQNWYPVRGHPEICAAPDVYAVFGRPKGHRGSWKQWLENDTPMTVVFEVRSPKNTDQEMADKQAFYDEYGVEEYYFYDPEENTLQVFRRQGNALRRVRDIEGYRSPRLGIVFDLSGPEMVVRYPNGDPFLSFEELRASLELHQEEAVELRRLADLEKQRADDEKRRADDAKKRADDEKKRADDWERRSGDWQQRASDGEAQLGLARMRLARLKELSRKARQQQATPEELAELDQLEGEP